MNEATIHFPRGFLWGSATAAHQVEGNNINNNWWAWEQEAGRIAHGHKSGLACDWWGGRWREDFDRAAEGYQNAHRYSVEWSRVQPTPDRWDEHALDRYREMVRGLVERDMTPMITLHHFTNPLWFEEMGGWENEAAVSLFEIFTRRVVESLKEYTSLWCTINEPNVYVSLGYVLGSFPPGKKDLRVASRVAENLVRAHAASYRAIHAQQPQARVGMALQYRSFKPAKPWFPFDNLVTGWQSGLFNDGFATPLKRGRLPLALGGRRVPEAKGTQDYIGLNYYTRELVSFNLLKAGELFGRRSFDPEAELSATGFIANEPQGLFEALKWANQFDLPILITENGVDDPEDRMRPGYIFEHIHQVWRAVNFNIPVKGYLYWTLVDNFEWERGWTQRFGLWELDIDTQARSKRPSADLYAKICRENGLSAQMVAQYAPGILDKIFPE